MQHKNSPCKASNKRTKKPPPLSKTVEAQRQEIAALKQSLEESKAREPQLKEDLKEERKYSNLTLWEIIQTEKINSKLINHIDILHQRLGLSREERQNYRNKQKRRTAWKKSSDRFVKHFPTWTINETIPLEECSSSGSECSTNCNNLYISDDDSIPEEVNINNPN